jgi:hypothetical protein
MMAQRTLLSLPTEIRFIIYQYVFTLDGPYDICRAPFSLQNDGDGPYFIDKEPRPDPATEGWIPGPAVSGHPGHLNRLVEDMYVGYNPITISAHYPCAHALRRGYSLSLSLLETCRKVYGEARHLVFTENVFRAWRPSTLSNFFFCLTSWQAKTITHLCFEIRSPESMLKLFPEWHELFALIAEYFTGLKTLSIIADVRFHPQHIARESFWNGGLRWLSRLPLTGLHIRVIDDIADPFFEYTAGVIPARMRRHLDGLPEALKLGSMKEAPPEARADTVDVTNARLILQQRYRSLQPDTVERQFVHSVPRTFLSPNPAPIYFRNLIHISTTKDWTDENIRRQNILQRDYSAYQYLYDEERKAGVYGFQYSVTDSFLADEQTIVIKQLAEARNRLAERMKAQKDIPSRTERREMWKQTSRRQFPTAANKEPSRQEKESWVVFEKPGSWRRRLYEEVTSPFVEFYPASLDCGDGYSGHKSLSFPVVCTGCLRPTHEPLHSFSS